MSFSFQMRAEDGTDLLNKYGINTQLLGCAGSESPYTLSDLRGLINRSIYACELPKAAKDTWKGIQEMVQVNIEELRAKNSHCDTCTCTSNDPDDWSTSKAEAILKVPLEEVHYISGGF